MELNLKVSDKQLELLMQQKRIMGFWSWYYDGLYRGAARAADEAATIGDHKADSTRYLTQKEL